MPPISCERAVRGLTIRPAANTPSSRGTRSSPVSMSTRTSTNCAPNACAESRSALPRYSAVSPWPSSRRPGPAGVAELCQGGARLDHGPPPGCRPGRSAGHRGLREIAVAHARRRSGSGASRASAASGSAPCAHPCRCRPRDAHRERAVGRAWSRACAGAWSRRVGRRTPRRIRSATPRAPGARPRVAVGPAEALRTVAQTADQVAAAESMAASGSTCGLVADRAGRRVDPGRDREFVHRRFECEHSRTFTGARIQAGIGTSSSARRWGVRRSGAAYITRVAAAVCSANSLSVELCSTTSCAIAAEPAVLAGAQPQALDGRRPVAREREHLLPGHRQLHGAADQGARPAWPRARAGAAACPSSRSLRRRARRGSRTRSGSRPNAWATGARGAVHALVEVVERRDRRPPTRASVAWGSIGLLWKAGVRVGRVDPDGRCPRGPPPRRRWRVSAGGAGVDLAPAQ